MPTVAEIETVISPLSRNQSELVDTACSAEHSDLGFAKRVPRRGRVMERFRHQTARDRDQI